MGITGEGALSDKPSGAGCRVCGKRLSPELLHRFWDGNYYCQKCLDDASPGLSDFCQAHTELAETTPLCRRRLLRRAILSSIWGCGSLVVGGLALGFLLGGERGAYTGSVFAVILGAIMTAPVLLRELLATPDHMPRIVVENGDVSITTPSSRSRGGPVVRSLYPSHADPDLQFPLTTLRWYLGTSTREWVAPSPDEPGVILVLPKRPLSLGWHRIACGFTPETRRVWMALLSLAGVRRASPRIARRRIWW